MNIENYRAVRINDCEDRDINYGIIMLNNKHKTKDFQQAIYDIKEKYFNEGNLDWQVEDLLSDKYLDKFDWFELSSDCYDYVEV